MPRPSWVGQGHEGQLALLPHERTHSGIKLRVSETAGPVETTYSKPTAVPVLGLDDAFKTYSASQYPHRIYPPSQLVLLSGGHLLRWTAVVSPRAVDLQDLVSRSYPQQRAHAVEKRPGSDALKTPAGRFVACASADSQTGSLDRWHQAPCSGFPLRSLDASSLVLSVA